MTSILGELAKQPYWVLTLVIGAALVVLPTITVDKDFYFSTHPPSFYLPVIVGITLLVVSLAAFGYTIRAQNRKMDNVVDPGLDLSRVKEDRGVLWTTVSDCEIHVTEGRVEDLSAGSGVYVLPCNEYFDTCMDDSRTALGSFVDKMFDGQAKAFAALVEEECRRRLGSGTRQQKTDDESAESFGPGRCLLLTRPLGRSTSVALVSTTTQRAGHGLAARISYLFDGMRELIARLADARIREITMPVLGAGHGGLNAPLAFVGLVLAIAEAARYGQGGQRLKKVTIVVFKRDAQSAPNVNPTVVRRALALVGTQS